MRRGVVGGVLHRDAAADDVLGAADARGDVMHGFLGERNRQQIVEVAVVAAIAQVFAVAGHGVLVEEAAHAGEESFVQRSGAAQRQRQAMADQRIARGQLAQLLAVASADADPVFRREFEEVEIARGAGRVRRGLQRAQQGPPQAEADGIRSQRMHAVHGDA
ncbi:hypothetical protein CATMIT_01749, partial [Catenibacterium mitsuokai DSM 15897]